MYPAIGPYDQTDPALVAYHCQLAKMVGLEGFAFDLGYYHDPQKPGKPTWAVKAMRTYRKAMQRYGLRAILIYEDKYHWKYDQTVESRKEAVQASYEDLNHWMRLFKPVQYRIGVRPLVGFFSYRAQFGKLGLGRLHPEEIRQWKSRFPANRKPVIVTQWLRKRFFGVMDGWMRWVKQKKTEREGAKFRARASLDILPDLLRQQHDKSQWMLNHDEVKLIIPAVWPGFDDRGVDGWTGEPRLTPRANGAVYRFTWRVALASQMPIIQIATWNDWFEATVVEPSASHGTQYLRITRRMVARHLEKSVPAGDLELPIWIYRLHTRSDIPPAAKQSADAAAMLIAEGQFKAATKRMEPWVERLNLGQPAYRND
jgi:hypothetical protein